MMIALCNWTFSVDIDHAKEVLCGRATSDFRLNGRDLEPTLELTSRGHTYLPRTSSNSNSFAEGGWSVSGWQYLETGRHNGGIGIGQLPLHYPFH